MRRRSIASNGGRATARNDIWSMDFVADQLADGRRFRALTMLDLFTRECLAIAVGRPQWT